MESDGDSECPMGDKKGRKICVISLSAKGEDEEAAELPEGKVRSNGIRGRS